MGILDELEASAKQSLIPLNLQWELTAHCNLSCTHCYQPRSGSCLSSDNKRLILDGAERAGILSIALTGGEPLCHPDFGQIYAEAKRKGFVVTVCTNGTLIDKHIISLFSEYKPFSVDISIYGSTREQYQLVTGKDRYADFREGLDNLRAAKIPFNLKVPITKKTILDLHGMDALARYYDVPFTIAAILYPRLDGNLQPLNERASVDQIFKFIPRNQSNNENLSTGNNRLRCAYARSTITVTPDCKIVFCSMMRSEGRVVASNSDFDKAISEHITHLDILEKLYASGDCGNCEYKSVCLGCPAQSLLHTGSPTKCVSYFKELAKKELMASI